MRHRRRQRLDSVEDVRQALAEGLHELRRQGAAFGGTQFAGVARATRSAPSAGGRPIYSEDQIVKDALHAARSEGQKLSPYTRKPTGAAAADLPASRFDELCAWLRQKGLSEEACQELENWLQGGG